MQLQVQNYNFNNQYKRNNKLSKNNQPQFTGMYQSVTNSLAKNYYGKFYNSKFAKWIVDHTANFNPDEITTHMAVLGSTLISGMYIVRTLQNEKLDPKKRKTLALNDLMTWGIATFLTYFADKKLASIWGDQTTRFVANFLKKHPEAKRPRTFGDWDPANIKAFMENEWHIKMNERIDKINAAINSPEYKGGRKPLKHVEASAYKKIEEFNLDVLKNKNLDGKIKGMGILKSLFIFGMIYRYIVPVMVMKPANKLGHYLHERNEKKIAEAQQNNETANKTKTTATKEVKNAA